ncbi:dnaJ homolog subfamily B member 3 [Impatiens glandulifera]|uniref:dnaJ homolog subfamily B member 3 n=1 Tax=Impatiens glandulifera TaxID=253017 RepID=UPI001FB077A3|nr:dnaJ homolog subfamily B member 3 [Impatiens glandulifera]
MVREDEEESKCRLVKEICDISSRAVTCFHRHRHLGLHPFIDWYLVLRVEENAKLDVIKKQYHKLALRLHPDKNKHPQAEAAFKLLHQAYICLSHDFRRQEFNMERQKKLYAKCCCSINRSSIISIANINNTTSSSKDLFDFRAKLSEEMRVIDNCLKSRRTRVFNKNSSSLPVFNPSDYLPHGYPHHRLNIGRTFPFQTDHQRSS